LHDPSNLGLRSHTQVTWVRRPFPTPFSLGLEKDVRPKLIIIIIIITTIIIIDFTLKIKYMFFFIVIIFILILIILIIRFNLFG